MSKVTAIVFFLTSVGMLFAALRARYRMGLNYTVVRVRAIGVTQVLFGVGTTLAGIVAIVESRGSISVAILPITSGVNFILAGALFWWAADHRSVSHS
jgi:hypothetical protein